MSETHVIAFLGFAATEQTAITRILALAGRSMPAHKVVDDVSSATLVIVNGSSRQIVRFFLKMRRQQRAIIIGDDDHESAIALCPRPIRVMELINALRRAAASEIPQILQNTDIQFAASHPLTTARPQPDSIAPRPTRSMAQLTAACQPSTASRVLIVDDSDLAALALSARLKKLNIDAHEARSGEDALAKAGIHSYHTIFLDVMMPDLDGYAVCRAMKRNLVRSGTVPKIAMLTSRGGAIDKIRGKMVGCDAFLTKPLSNESLQSTLREFGLLI